jgi:hypothetical protein
MTSAVDYTHRIDPQALKNAGINVVSRYLGPLGLTKVIGSLEYNELVLAGITVYLNWEDFSTDWITLNGHHDGREAVRQAGLLGYPKYLPITGSCDFDVQSLDQIMSYGLAFRDEVHAAGWPVGVYGPTNVLDWCASAHYDFFWQSMSTGFTGGANGTLNKHTDWWQRRGITIAGQQCDTSDIIRPIHGGTEMTMLATDGTKFYVCDGMTSREISANSVGDFVYVAGQGLCSLAHGVPGKEWANANVRAGWSEAVFGRLVTSGQGGSVAGPTHITLSGDLS